MTQKSNKLFVDEVSSKPPKKNYPTKKTDVCQTDDFESVDILDLKDYGPENKRGYRSFLFIIDIFSKYGCTKPLKSKNAQTVKDSFKKLV